MNLRAVRLNRFKVKGYRSCKNTTLRPNRALSVLIGLNGAGKTNILNGLLLMRTPFGGRHSVTRPDHVLSSFKCDLEADFAIGDFPVSFRSSIVFRTSESNKDSVIETSEKWKFQKIGKLSGWIDLAEDPFFFEELILPPRHGMSRSQYVWWSKSAIRKARTLQKSIYGLRREQRSQIVSAVKLVQEFLSKISYYSASQFTNPGSCPNSFEIDEDGDLFDSYSPRSKVHEKFIFDLYSTYQKSRKQYDRYISTVDPTGLGLIDDISWHPTKITTNRYEVESGGKLHSRVAERILVIPTIHIGDAQLSFNQLSEGTFRTLALLFYIVTDDSRLLLIEEPEVCVHHGLLDSVIELIKHHSHRRQIIFSTHSDFVLDRIDPENVFLVSKSKEKDTTVTPISNYMAAKRFSALKRYLAKSGNLGEYWKESGFGE